MGLVDPSTDDEFYTFLSERQRIFHTKALGAPWPWTEDARLDRAFFTNPFRASDRTSQDYLRVAYTGSQTPEEIFLRTWIFKQWNMQSTYDLFLDAFGEVSLSTFDVSAYSDILEAALLRGENVYSGAFLVFPPGQRRGERKHVALLGRIEQMLSDGVPAQLQRTTSLGDAYSIIRGYKGMGNFASYQFTTDLNYTRIMSHPESDFCAIGPDTGAERGVRAIRPTGDAVQHVRDIASGIDAEMGKRGLWWENLWGRDLQLVDTQNCFCEFSKYLRMPRDKYIRRRNGRGVKPTQLYFFPPKWGINSNIPDQVRHPLCDVFTTDAQASPLTEHRATLRTEHSAPGQSLVGGPQ